MRRRGVAARRPNVLAASAPVGRGVARLCLGRWRSSSPAKWIPIVSLALTKLIRKPPPYPCFGMPHRKKANRKEYNGGRRR